MKTAIKLTAGFFIICTIIWALGIIAIELSQKALQETTGKYTADMAEEIAGRIQYFIFAEIIEQQEFAKTADISEIALQSNKEFDKMPDAQSYITRTDADWNKLTESTASAAEKILETPASKIMTDQTMRYKKLQQMPEYTEIFATNKYGAVIAMSRKTSDYRQDYKLWWAEAKNKGRYSYYERDESTGANVFVIAQRLTDSKGNFAGVLKTALIIEPLLYFIQELKGIATFKNTKVTLADSIGRIISSTEKYPFMQELPSNIHAQITENKGHFIAKKNGKNVLISYARADVYPAKAYAQNTVLVEHELENVFLPIKKLRITIIFASVLSVLAAILTAFIFSRTIVYSTNALSDAAAQIEKGNLNVRIKIKTKDEFELVAKTFNKMRKALLEEKTKSWQRLKKVERLTLALTHMLNRLKKSYEKIKDLDRLKDEFLQSTSHELKTPLTSLSGFTELMMAGKLGKLTKKQSEATKVIKFDVERLTNSITKILDVARIEAGKKLDYSTLDLNSLVKEIVSPLKLAAQHKKLDFTTTLKHLPKISADKKWLVQVIQNLVHNAVKYTQKGKIIVATEKDGNNVKLTVTDTGPGIKSEYIQFLFTKFFQVTHTQSGSGLGLYICKKVIDQHGGKMIVNSEYGKGSTFGFTIPIKARKTTL